QDPAPSHKCPLCENAFHQAEHLKRHIRTHAAAQSHACEFFGCTKRFARLEDLTRHAQRHETTGEKAYKAPQVQSL
ncbi:hypothetical protein B0J14DRAFT_439104, partial [Halenospora varia]